MLEHAVPLYSWFCVLPVVLGLLGAGALLLFRHLTVVQPWLCLVVLLAMLACDGVLLEQVLRSGPVSMTMGNWPPPFGISFTADAMGAGFALAAAFVAIAAVIDLMGDAPRSAVLDGIYPLVLLMVAGVSGAFLTGDIFNLYVWFEVMLIASFGLMVTGTRPIHLDAAVKYGILNIVATTLFLAGLGLLYGLLGTLNMADIVGAARKADAPTLTAIAALIALAFATKAAAFPLNSWLPASYHTPPAALAALIAALLTKVGVYALLKSLIFLWPVAGASLAIPIETIALATAIIGPLCAVGETGLRRSVGFMLIGGVGVSLLALAEPTIGTVAGAASYVFAAIVNYAALYIIAGLIERATGMFDEGTKEIRSPGPSLALLFFTCALSAAGIPPLLGFWPKLLLLRGFLDAGNMLLAFAVLGNALLSLIAVSRLWSRVFWQPSGSVSDTAQPPRIASATLLAGAVVVLGLAPGHVISAAMTAASDLLDPARYIAAVGLAP